MKIRNQFLALSVATLFFVGCNENKTNSSTTEEGKVAQVELKDAKDTLSYALGNNYAQNVLNSEKTLDVNDKINKDEVVKAYEETLKLLKGKSHSYRQGFLMAFQREMMERELDTTASVLNSDLVLTGLKDGLNGAEFDQQGGQEAFRKYFIPFQQKAQEKMQKRAEARNEILKNKNEEEGKKFVEEKKKEGFKETESGLLYKVIKEGDVSKKPTEKDVAKVIYTGKLISGKEFDSSKGEARDMSVSGVVPGFKEALLMMGKGTKMQIVLPAKLAYGEGGSRGIEPNSTLIFDVEVADFGAAPAAPKGKGQPQLTPEQVQQLMKQQQGK